MRRIAVVVAVSCLCLVPVVPASADPPTNPNQTGQCVSTTAQDRMGPPEQPSVSFPFECPPPPPFQL